MLGLKPIHCIADFSRELKKATSIWAAREHESEFEWQEGYAVFAISKSLIDTVSHYIEHQDEHHQKLTFADELKLLLEKHGVKYDPKYLL